MDHFPVTMDHFPGGNGSLPRWQWITVSKLPWAKGINLGLGLEDRPTNISISKQAQGFTHMPAGGVGISEAWQAAQPEFATLSAH